MDSLYGRQKQKPKPYLKPALDAAKKEYRHPDQADEDRVHHGLRSLGIRNCWCGKTSDTILPHGRITLVDD